MKYHFNLGSLLNVSCGIPDPVINGYRIGNKFNFNETVHYQCNEGHAMTGRSSRTCLKSGRWSGDLPKCSKIIPVDFMPTSSVNRIFNGK